MNDDFKCDNVNDAIQVAFTLAVRGIASQGWERCMDADDARCVWHRGAPGKHCAIGWLIPWDKQKGVAAHDHEVETALEHSGYLYPELDKYIGYSPFYDFLTQLQAAHDDGPNNQPDTATRMQKRLWRLGVNNELKWPEDVPKPDTR